MPSSPDAQTLPLALGCPMDDPIAPHRGLRLHGARLCEAYTWTGILHAHSRRARRARAIASGLGHDRLRTCGWARGPLRLIYSACKRVDARHSYRGCFTVHLPNGFSSIKLQAVTAAGAHFGQPGYETDLLYIAALLALVLGGSGPLALDQLLIRRLCSRECLGRPRVPCHMQRVRVMSPPLRGPKSLKSWRAGKQAPWKDPSTVFRQVTLLG